MLNQVVCVGRIATMEWLKDIDESDRDAVNLTLAIPRTYKNTEGEYDTDFIPVILYGPIASNTTEYCKKGDIVGIKGRLAKEENQLALIAEKVTFLSSKSSNSSDDEQEGE